MAYLINRNPPGRIECLHNLCKFISSKYNIGEQFNMKDIKYNPQENNILNHCNLLKSNSLLNIKYCPYKDNPLNTSGCSLTNGVNDDTTKSKEISNTVNALDSLGFLYRRKRNIEITHQGLLFAKTEYNSIEMLQIIRKAVSGYGMFIGFLAQIKLLGKNSFDTNEITLGYPNSNEKILYEGNSIIISSGSESDSNTRTKSCLLAWGISCGFFIPENLDNDSYDADTIYQEVTRNYTLAKKRNLRKYKIKNFPDYLFNGNHIVTKPLDYNNLTKNTGALRENNQAKIRELTLKVEPKIKNRRYAIIYALNKAYLEKTTLDFDSLIDFLNNYPDLFIVNQESFDDVMYSELNIAFMVGTPFSIGIDNELKPLVGVDMSEVNLGAPADLINVMNKFNI
jgi:hypothetical protein